MAYNITVNLNPATTDPIKCIGAKSTNPTTIEVGGSAELEFYADGVYYALYPTAKQSEAITVSGASISSWTCASPYTGGKLIINNPTGDVSITLNAKNAISPLPYGKPFELSNKSPVDIRTVLTKEQMLNAKVARQPDTYFAICKDDGRLYIYNKSFTKDATIGYFRPVDQSLVFNDLSATFKQDLKDFIGQTGNTLYRLLEVEENLIWKLQKSNDGGTTWVDEGSQVNIKPVIEQLETEISLEEERAKLAEAAKVDKEIIGTNGKALIFNEADGGGAKFENNNGIESFVGVNDGSNGIVAQIYADKFVDGKWQGAKLDVKNDGIFYTVGNQSAAQRDVAENELAVKGDISEYTIVKDAEPGEYASVYHLTKDGVNVGAPIEIAKDQLLKSVTVKTCTEKDKPISGLNPGDKYIDFEFETTAGTTHSYIAVKDMVKPYSAGDGIAIDADNKISVSSIGIAKVDGLQNVLDAKADLPGQCPPWLNPTGETPYPWFMASLDVESAGLGPDAEGNLKANVGAYNFNIKQYYKWEKSLPFAATTTKAGLMTASDKVKVDNAITEEDTLILNCNL